MDYTVDLFFIKYNGIITNNDSLVILQYELVLCT